MITVTPSEQRAALLQVIGLVGRAIQELGEVPSGELYARLMGHMSLGAVRADHRSPERRWRGAGKWRAPADVGWSCGRVVEADVMLSSKRQNVHHSKLPTLGAIVEVHVERRLASGNRWRRFIVESFPLCDAADWRYSRGIHTVNVRALDNGARFRVSGFYCVEVTS